MGNNINSEEKFEKRTKTSTKKLIKANYPKGGAWIGLDRFTFFLYHTETTTTTKGIFINEVKSKR